jgi:hypothetical protein
MESEIMADDMGTNSWLAAFGILGGAGVVGKAWDYFFNRHERRLEVQKKIQEMIDARIKIVIDEQRNMMNDLRDEVEKQSTKNDRLESKVDALHAAIDLLTSHVSTLEDALRAKKLPVPPRPRLSIAD